MPGIDDAGAVAAGAAEEACWASSRAFCAETAAQRAIVSRMGTAIPSMSATTLINAPRSRSPVPLYAGSWLDAWYATGGPPDRFECTTNLGETRCAKISEFADLPGIFPDNLHEMSESAAVRRALADDHRALIVDELRSARDGLDVREPAHRLGLHANTVRCHLGVSDTAGPPPPGANGRPGSPPMLYRLRRGAAAPSGGDEHRLLATILTGAVAALPDGEV